MGDSLSSVQEMVGTNAAAMRGGLSYGKIGSILLSIASFVAKGASCHKTAPMLWLRFSPFHHIRKRSVSSRTKSPYQPFRFKLYETYPVVSEDFSFTQPSNRRLNLHNVDSSKHFDDDHAQLPGSQHPLAPQVCMNCSDSLYYTFIKVDIIDGVWLKLVPGEEVHELAYGDVFKVGSITMKAQR